MSDNSGSGGSNTLVKDDYLAMAAMWVYAVGIYNLQLEQAVDDFQSDQHASHFRRELKEHSDEYAAQWADHLKEIEGQELTVASVWRMTLARHMFLNAVAQLRKCVLELDGFGVPVPQLQDSKLIRLLRDVDEHWEQVDQGRSLNELRQLMPDEGSGRIEYTNKYIWLAA